jgi:hypothetical protein
MASPLARALTSRAVLAAGAVAALIAALALQAQVRSPLTFLTAQPPARWLRAGGAVWLGAHERGPRFTRFRTRFDAGAAGVDAELTLRVRAASEVVLDGREWLPAGEADERRTALRAGPGRHELIVVVKAEAGPPLLWAEAPQLGLFSDERWEASADGGRSWSPAVDAARTPRDEVSVDLPSSARGFLSTVFFLLPFCALGAACARRSGRAANEHALDAALVVVAAAAWFVLAASALFLLRPGLGYDAQYHLAYVAELAGHQRLPVPGDYWQSFEPPLYYALCVPLRGVALAFGAEPAVWLRLPNLISGFLLGWTCRMFVATARPGRPRLELAAGLFGWFWPASLTLAQAPGCEPLAGVLAALFLAGCARESSAARALRPRAALGLGALFGAAVLAKATAGLAFAPGLFLLDAPLRKANADGRRRGAALFLAAAFVAGGWFYARSWILYGAPLIGDWNAGREVGWWQDPGYRMSGDFLRFGAALARPFYSGFNGFWDALYSTFWADGWQSGAISAASLPPRPFIWQAAEVWWALIPTALIARGAVRALKVKDAPSGAALLGVFLGLAALAWMFLTLPIYGTVKASYLLGLAPLFALLLADGLDATVGAAKYAAWAGLFAWAAASYRAALPL